MTDPEYSYEERIIIDNYLEHINDSRHQISFMLNYLSTSEQQLSRLLPENYRRIGPRQPPLTHYTSSRNILSNIRHRQSNISRYERSTPVPNTSTPVPNTSTPVHNTSVHTSNMTSYLNLLNTIRQLNAQHDEFENPVFIMPTQLQINNATEQLIYDDTLHLRNSICPITQQSFEHNDPLRRIRYCDHVFTETSLMRWFERSVRCPVCRYDIRDYITSSNTDTDTGISNTNVDDEFDELEPTMQDISNTTTQFIADISRNCHRSYNYPSNSIPIPEDIINSVNDISNNSMTNSITVSSTSSSFLSDLISEDLRINPLLQILDRLRNTNTNTNTDIFDYSISGDILHINSSVQ